MYESKLQELHVMDEILKADPQCAEQACKGLCTGACHVVTNNVFYKKEEQSYV